VQPVESSPFYPLGIGKGIRIEIGAALPTEPPSIVVIAVRDVHHKFEFDFEFAPKHQQQRAQQWIRTNLEAGYHR